MCAYMCAEEGEGGEGISTVVEMVVARRVTWERSMSYGVDG